MANIFDQFDGGGNPFDQFDTAKAPVKIGAEAFPDVLRETLNRDRLGNPQQAAGQAVENMWEGLKDALARVTRQTSRRTRFSRKKLR